MVSPFPGMTDYKTGSTRLRQRAASAAAPGRRRSSTSIEGQNAKAEKFNRYRDSVDALPTSVLAAHAATMRPKRSEGIPQFFSEVRAKHGAMRAKRGSMQVSPMMSHPDDEPS